MATKEMAEAQPKPKREIETLIDRLKKLKKKPEDWVFVPRRKKFEKVTVMIEDGEAKLVSDGSGGFKPQVVKRPVMVTVYQTKGIGKDGAVIGGYRPSPIGSGEAAWTAQEVLEEMIELSLTPSCEVVPYEAREVGKEAKAAEMNLVEERALRQEAEAKLRALEDGNAQKDARLKELEAALAEKTKK